MDREPPPVTVTAPGREAPTADLLDHAPGPRPRPGAAAALVLLAVVVLATAVVRAAPEEPEPAPLPPPVAAPVPARTAPAGVTAAASLGGAATDDPYVQRLSLRVDLRALDARSDPTGQPLGEEVVLTEVRLRGFTVTLDDERSPLPLGRFGRSTSGRSTTVPLTASAAVEDCAIEPQARRDIVLRVRTGDGPTSTVQVAVGADVVRALDRLVSRACRRPRG